MEDAGDRGLDELTGSELGRHGISDAEIVGLSVLRCDQHRVGDRRVVAALTDVGVEQRWELVEVCGNVGGHLTVDSGLDVAEPSDRAEGVVCCQLGGEAEWEADVFELVRDVVVRGRGLLERGADTVLDGLTNDQGGRDQGQADHQRRSGGGGAARIAGRVLLGQPTSDTAGLRERPAEHSGDDTDGHGAEEGDREEDADRSDRHQGDRCRGATGTGQSEGTCADSDPEQAEAGHDPGAASWCRRIGSASQSLDGGDRSCPPGRADGGEHGDADTDHDGGHDGSGGDDRRGVGKAAAGCVEQRLEALGHADTAADAASRSQDADDECLAEDRSADLGRAGADGAEQREFLGALPEDDGEGVVDDEDGDEQRDAAEAEEDVADDVDLTGELVARLLGHRVVVDHVGPGDRRRHRGVHLDRVGTIDDLDVDGVDTVDAEQLTGLTGVHLHEDGAQGLVVDTEGRDAGQGQRRWSGRCGEVVAVADHDAVFGGGVEIDDELTDIGG